MKICNNLGCLCTKRYPVDPNDISKGYACALPENDLFGCMHSTSERNESCTNAEIDNFDQISSRILEFKGDGDFYLVLVLKRRKDVVGKVEEGVNEDNRPIKHFFVYSKEYLLSKKQTIINLCRANNARAYVLPQRRSTETILWELHEKTGSLIREGNSGVHFDHLIRSCVAGCHKSDRAMWIIDVDRDNELLSSMSDYEFEKYVSLLKDKIIEIRETFGQEAKGFMLETIRTPHGIHIVTEPFNKHELIHPTKTSPFGPIESDWIKPDAMTLLFCSP